MASWVQEYNYTVSRAYWRNASTGETSWDPPGAAGSAGTVDAEQASAVALQAHIKGRQVRKEQEQRATSAKMVQSVYRGREARHQLSGGARRKKYYTPADVAAHDRADDLWVVDLSDLVFLHAGPLAQPLIEAAGTDITHWFDPATHGLRRHIDPKTGTLAPFVPLGRFIHCPPAGSGAEFDPAAEVPWWLDDSLVVGALTRKTRSVRLLNMLTQQETALEVCAEETLDEIQQRYLDHNAHSGSYAWKRTDARGSRFLDMRRTLEANGVPDEDRTFDSLSIPDDFYVPTLHLYFADDLTASA